MIEIRTFQGNAYSVQNAIHNAETQANTYLWDQGFVNDVRTHAQTLDQSTGDQSWYIHIITLTINTPKQIPTRTHLDESVLVGTNPEAKLYEGQIG